MCFEVTVCISTSYDRLAKVVLPDFNSRVKYSIVYQPIGAHLSQVFIDELLKREDVDFYIDDGAGLSRSRNLAIERVTTPYFIIMDDDVEIDVFNVIKLVERMSEDDCDIGTCIHLFEDNLSPKKYKSYSHSHNLFSVASVSSIDICCKTKSIARAGLRFDERFGLGTNLPSGEEYIFLTSALKGKLRVNFYPIPCSVHPAITSGADFFTEKQKIRAKREMLKVVFGYFSFGFIFLFWLKKSIYVARRGYFLKFTRYMLIP